MTRHPALRIISRGFAVIVSGVNVLDAALYSNAPRPRPALSAGRSAVYPAATRAFVWRRRRVSTRITRMAK